MAKYADVQENFQGGDYVKIDQLFERETVFNVVDARVVETPFRDKLTGDSQEGVEFTIQYPDPDENEGIAQKKFTLALNTPRQKFVDYFNAGGEKLEDMEICKLSSTGKGNPPWGFKASAGEAFPASASQTVANKVPAGAKNGKK